MNSLVKEHGLIEIICSELPDLISIYVFGSAASDELRVDSDLDLAILPARATCATQLWSLAQLLAVSVGRDVDLVDLLSATTVMRAQVVSKGHRLYCQDETLCGEFEDRVYADYARLNEERR